MKKEHRSVLLLRQKIGNDETMVKIWFSLHNGDNSSFSYYTLKIYTLLLLLLLTLPLLVLHASGSHDTRFVSAYSTEDLAISYNNGMYTLAIFDNVLDTFGGNPFEHQKK